MCELLKRALALTLCLVVCLPGCRKDSGDTGDEPPKDTVKVSNSYFGIAYYSDDEFNPVTDNININRIFCEALYEGLFEVSSNFTAQNVLCGDYVGDGTEFTFTLKDGVKFWSGKALTADDVVGSYEAARQSESSPYHSRLSDVESIEALNRSQVRIKLSSPNINLPRLLDIPIYRASSSGNSEEDPEEDPEGNSEEDPEEGSEGNSEEDPEEDPEDNSEEDPEEDSEDNSGEDPGDSPEEDVEGDEEFVDGTGPFKPVRNGPLLTLEPNEYWNGGFLGTIRHISVVTITKADAANAAFQTGDVSIMREPRIAPDGSSSRTGGATETVPVNSANLHFLGFNYNNGKLAEAEVRQALSMAISRKSICDVSLQSFADPALLPVNPQPEVEGVEINMEANSQAAAELLKDAKLEGQLEISLLVNENNSFKCAAAEQIAGAWNALDGVKVTLEKVSYNSFVSRLNSGSFDVYYGETQLSPDFDLRPLVSSGGKLNYGGYSSEKTARAIAAARKGDDVASLYKCLLSEMPIIPIAFEKSQIIIRKGMVENFSPAPYNAFAGQEAWTMPED